MPSDLNLTHEESAFPAVHRNSPSEHRIWLLFDSLRLLQAWIFVLNNPRGDKNDEPHENPERFLVSNRETVSGIEPLAKKQDLVNVKRMSGPSCQGVSQDLKYVTQPAGVVNIDIDQAFVTFHEKSELQIAVRVIRLEAPGIG